MNKNFNSEEVILALFLKKVESFIKKYPQFNNQVFAEVASFTGNNISDLYYNKGIKNGK